MNKHGIYLTSLLMLGAFSAQAAEVTTGTVGQAEAGYQFVDGADTYTSKEYRDLDSGLVINGMYDGYTEGGYHYRVTGKDLAFKNREVYLDGGVYNSYKYQIRFIQLVHNYSLGAKTFYSGVGTDNLTYSATDRAANTDSEWTPTFGAESTWGSSFDYGIERTITGLSFEGDFDTPYFFKASMDAIKTEGTKISGIASGVYRDKKGTQGSAFGLQFELPEPVGHNTMNTHLVGGYKSEGMVLAVDVAHSTFVNDYDTLTFRNPYVTTKTYTGYSVMEPDNTFMNAKIKGSFFNLPLNSTLSFSVGQTSLTSESEVYKVVPGATSGNTGAGTSPTYADVTLTANADKFKGDNKYDKANLIWTSYLTDDLDFQVYYRMNKRTNNNTAITYTNGSDTVSNEHFAYDKTRYGIETGYKMPMDSKLWAGVGMASSKYKERLDSTETKDTSAFLKLTNDTLDNTSFKLKVNYLARTSDFAHGSTGTDKTDSKFIHRNLRRFDVTDKTMMKTVVGADSSFGDNLQVGLEVGMKSNDYSETFLGLQEDNLQTLFADVSYSIPELVSFYFYADYETGKAKSQNRRFSPGGADPNDAPTSSNHNWTSERTMTNQIFGAEISAPIIEDTLDIVVSYSHENYDAKNDIEAQDNITTYVDIEGFGDFKKDAYGLKLRYKHGENLTGYLGYLHQEMTVDDAQFNGYKNESDFSNRTLLTGAYSDTNYKMDLAYLSVAYSF